MKNLKLGKKAVRLDERTFKLSRYLPTLPPVPPAADWSGKVAAWGMMANDSVGDCTCAAAGHLEMLWTSEAGIEFTPADADVLAAYSAISGYNPGDANSDQGADELSVLNYWRQTGIACRRIYSFATVNVSNLAEVRAAVALFGGLYIGVQLPQSAMDAVDAGAPWINVSDQNILGGHAVPIVAYDTNGLTCITWGKPQRMTWDWFAKYCDEAYVVLSPDWIANSGQAPSGFDLAQLNLDLKAL